MYFGKPTTIGKVFRIENHSKIGYDSEYTRMTRMTNIGFISSVGGLFGLCLGFSFVSVFEILYWGIIVLTRNMLRYQQ